MDDPFGPSLVILIALALAAVIRAAEAAIPFIDEGELRRRAEGGSARARRGLRLVRRAADAGFGEFRMAYGFLLLIAGAAAFALLGGRLTARFADLGARLSWLAVGACVLVPFALIAFTLTGVIPGHLAAHWRERLFEGAAQVDADAAPLLAALFPPGYPYVWIPDRF